MSEDPLPNMNQDDGSDFEALVNQHQERILNLCYRFVNNREDAEDVSQDVFVEVYRSLKGFRGDAKLATWIHKIAVNKSLDFVRKKKRKRRFGLVKRFLGLDEAENELPAPQSLQPEAVFETREQATILRQAVESLSEKQRTVVILNKYEELSYAEVAEVMGTTVSAVDALLQRGMKNLRKKLYTYYQENWRE